MGTCHRWARHKRQPSEGELLQRAPHTIHHHLDHHLSHTFPGRMRPKKEDWLKKKDRKQRRPGREGELLPRAPLFHVRLSSVLGTASSLTDPLTDTSTPTRCPPDNSSRCKTTHRT